jgi:hypothetical protein
MTSVTIRDFVVIFGGRCHSCPCAHPQEYAWGRGGIAAPAVGGGCGQLHVQAALLPRKESRVGLGTGTEAALA